MEVTEYSEAKAIFITYIPQGRHQVLLKRHKEEQREILLQSLYRNSLR